MAIGDGAAAGVSGTSLDGFFTVNDSDCFEDVAPRDRRHRPMPMKRTLANVMHKKTFAALGATEVEQASSERADIAFSNSVAPTVSRVGKSASACSAWGRHAHTPERAELEQKLDK